MLDAGRQRRAPTGAGVASAGGPRPAGVFSRLSSRRQGVQMAYIRIFNPPNVTADVYDRVNAEAALHRDPLAIDAPEPAREIPFKPSRMIHFLDFSNEKMVAKVPDIAPQVDILLGNLEDAVPLENKEAARAGLIKVGREMDLGETALWARVNELASPFVLDDITHIVSEIGDRIEVTMIPKVEGPWDIHYVDRLLAQLEARAGLERPILIHAILETSLGVVNLEEIATASPRMQGMSFGPADLAASRRMKTTRVGGGHPGYRVIEDPNPSDPDAPRKTAQQDPWHYSIARMVDACAAVGILPFYGPYGDIRDV